MGLKDIFGKKKDQKNDFKAMKLGDSKKPQNNSVKEPKNNTLDVQTNDFLHDKEHEKFLETLSENKAKNLFLQVGDIATLNYK